MNSRERVLGIINHQDVDRIPVDLWYTPEIAEQLRFYTGAKNDFQMYKKLGLDKIVWVSDLYAATAGHTKWGSPLKRMQAGTALYSEIDSLALKEYNTSDSLKDYPHWPNPDKYDYEQMTEQAKTASEDYCTLGPWISLFEVYCQLRGLEQAMIDLVMMPDYVQAALDKIETCQTNMLQRFLKKAAQYIDLVFISDDMGSQNNLLMSPEMWDVFFRERLKRWCDLIHSCGVKVFYHSDGAMEGLIPRLVEAGVDVLNPIQHICPGMDRTVLKEKYEYHLVFHGGIENQSVLPFGTKQEVRLETLECLKTLGKGMKGYICCSCHNVQPGTPIENILEMIKTVHDYSG